MYFSPHAMSQNGTAALRRPSTIACRHAVPEPPHSVPRAERDHQVGEQDDARDQRPREHQRTGREPAVDADLDEEVRGAPDGGEREDQRPVPPGHAGTLAARRSRARPVASAVPVSTSASPASATAVTASSRKTRPVDERERGHEVGDEDRPRCAGARDDREVEEVGDPRAEHAERDDGEPGLRRRRRRRAAAGARTAPSARRRRRAGRARPAAAGSRASSRRRRGRRRRSRRRRRSPRAAPMSSPPLCTPTSSADADEADPDADEAGAGRRAGSASIRDASMTVKIGAAAWITAVRPGVEPRLGEAEQPERHRVVERAEHDDGQRRGPAAVRARRAPGSRASRSSAPKKSRPKATTDGSKASTPSLMKRNDAPQMEERSSSRRASRRVTSPP